MIYQSNDQFLIGNGSSLNIHYIRNSILPFHHYSLKLCDVFHVPTIAKNLMYVHKLTNDNNIYVQFHASYYLVKGKATWTPLL